MANDEGQVRREVDVFQAECPDCGKTFDRLAEGELVPRHKTPREHPGEREWDEREGGFWGSGNLCPYEGLPKVRKVGSFTFEGNELSAITIGGGD